MQHKRNKRNDDANVKVGVEANFYQHEVFLRFSIGKAVERLAGEERRSVLTG